MHKVFRSPGELRALTDFNGDPIEHDFSRKVLVDARYELKPSPHQPLILDIYGYDLSAGAGRWTERLSLDNGLVLTGKISGGMAFRSGESPRLRRIRMFDVKQTMLHLDPDQTAQQGNVEIDAAVFAVVSSDPLASGACSEGAARPGFPFSFANAIPRVHKVTWSTRALRLEYGAIGIFFSGTSNYWKNLVDQTALPHESIVGIRRLDGSLLAWAVSVRQRPHGRGSGRTGQSLGSAIPAFVRQRSDGRDPPRTRRPLGTANTAPVRQRSDGFDPGPNWAISRLCNTCFCTATI